MTTSRIRGNLSLRGYGNPELNSKPSFDKCVETRGFASSGEEDGIVRYSFEKGREQVSRNSTEERGERLMLLPSNFKGRTS